MSNYFDVSSPLIVVYCSPVIGQQLFPAELLGILSVRL